MARTATDTLRIRLLTALCALALVLGPAVCTARAQDSGTPAAQTPATAPAATADSTAAPQPAAIDPAPTVDAATQQVAAATATATQQAPQNVAIPVQVLSPGDSGPITQVNTAGAGADAVNQVAAPASAPEAATSVPPATSTGQQSATATAQATQIAPANVYIPVSVLSPGDHGPVTQVNSTSAQATATNLDQAGAGAGTAPAPPAQTAGAGAAATQPAPANFAAPVTVGGVDVGEHPATTPWVWTWVWELDCGSTAAAPPVAALAPVISQVTGGAWEWHWTWTCSATTGDPSNAPGAGTPPGSVPETIPPVPAGASPGATAPVAGPTAAPLPGSQPAATVAPDRPSAQNLAAHARHRRPTHGATSGAPLAVTPLRATRGFLDIPSDIATDTVISPTRVAHSAPAHTRRPIPAPDPRPTPPAPPALAAGASGGSGGAPLSIGLAALIGAFLLTVPRFGARTRTQLVHRSAQAVPDAKDRPG